MHSMLTDAAALMKKERITGQTESFDYAFTSRCNCQLNAGNTYTQTDCTSCCIVAVTGHADARRVRRVSQPQHTIILTA